MKTVSTIPIAAVAATAILLACSGSRSEQRTQPATAAGQATQPAPRAGAEMGSATSGTCPMDVPDTQVSAADTAQGEALTFTTSSGQVDELRRRVRAFTDMHNGHHAGTGVTESGTGAGDEVQHLAGNHAGHGMMPASHATVEDVNNGVRVNIVPDDPAQVDQVRSMARMHAEHMQSQGCAMMHGAGG